METKKPVWYSLIRYSPDNIKGEIINVGLVLHSIGTDKQTKCYILDENCVKIKYLLDNITEINTYKSYKEVLEYYISKSRDNLLGQVGNIIIGSYYDDDYLNKIKNEFKNKKMTISEPNFAFTRDIDLLFESIFDRYIGKKYLIKHVNTLTAKSYAKNIFKEKELLGTKVNSDITVYPIEKLKSVKFKVDFSFKNGVENYIQAIPNLTSNSKNAEWFAKTELIINSLKDKDTKLHFIYKSSDFDNNRDVYELINYFSYNNDKVKKLDLDKTNEILELCNYIKNEAEDITKVG